MTRRQCQNGPLIATQPAAPGPESPPATTHIQTRMDSAPAATFMPRNSAHRAQVLLLLLVLLQKKPRGWVGLPGYEGSRRRSDRSDLMTRRVVSDRVQQRLQDLGAKNAAGSSRGQGPGQPRRRKEDRHVVNGLRRRQPGTPFGVCRSRRGHVRRRRRASVADGGTDTRPPPWRVAGGSRHVRAAGTLVRSGRAWTVSSPPCRDDNFAWQCVWHMARKC